MKKIVDLPKSFLSVVALTGALTMPALSTERHQSRYDTQLQLALSAKHPTEDQTRIIRGQMAIRSVTLDKNPIPTEPKLLKKRGEEVTKELNDLRSKIEALGDEAKKQLKAQDESFKADWYVCRSTAVGYAKKLSAPSLAEDPIRNSKGWECAILNYQERMKLEHMPSTFINHPDMEVVIPYYDRLLSVIDVQILQQRRLSLKMLLGGLKVSIPH